MILGVFTGDKQYANHLTVKGATQGTGKHLKTVKCPGGFMTEDEGWREVFTWYHLNY